MNVMNHEKWKNTKKIKHSISIQNTNKQVPVQDSIPLMTACNVFWRTSQATAMLASTLLFLGTEYEPCKAVAISVPGIRSKEGHRQGVEAPRIAHFPEMIK